MAVKMVLYTHIYIIKYVAEFKNLFEKRQLIFRLSKNKFTQSRMLLNPGFGQSPNSPCGGLGGKLIGKNYFVSDSELL